MSQPLQSLIASGTKLWLDSVNPHEVARNRAWGATGATSNPIIVAELVESGRLDDQLDCFLRIVTPALSDESLCDATGPRPRSGRADEITGEVRR